MVQDVQTLSIKGKQRVVPAISIGSVAVVIKGRVLKVAQIHDEIWLDAGSIPDPLRIIDELRSMQNPPDIFTFTQSVPDVTPKYDYHLEWDNFAVTHTASYEEWFERVISAEARKKIRKAAKKGVTTEIVPFNDELIRSIKEIYDEAPFRQGKRFWHYGKDIETIREENGTYLDRSTFVGAFFEGKLIGFVKLVWKGSVGSTMQVISRTEHFDKAPNNALLAKAVLICSTRSMEYLTYGEYSHRNDISSLTDFKRVNGFGRMELPRYYVPLTNMGSLALRLSLHKNIRERFPDWILALARDFRERWYKGILFGRDDKWKKKAMPRS